MQMYYSSVYNSLMLSCASFYSTWNSLTDVSSGKPESFIWEFIIFTLTISHKCLRQIQPSTLMQKLYRCSKHRARLQLSTLKCTNYTCNWLVNECLQKDSEVNFQCTSLHVNFSFFRFAFSLILFLVFLNAFSSRILFIFNRFTIGS